ncbi:MarR family winged helix-turn-helix transcriptional regulator [Nocardioides sp. NPDC057767]|uniref:MarR family winged helix-turn-helix transcriptional regulator n=1 Tax=unclassified Nocardioides TaxID=2615069 RepID=UPI00366B7703
MPEMRASETSVDDIPEDRADRHVARWRDHWLDIDFDDEVEAITVRIGSISKFFSDARRAAASEVGLADFEYMTLHQLMIRDTPGHASPTALAKDLDISPAGMTGRLDSMEKAGWVRRTASVEDRRKISVEATKAGIEIWRRAMDLRGEAENRLLEALSPERRTELAAMLKQVTLRLEAE